MDYTLVHYNAKVKTTPLSLAYPRSFSTHAKVSQVVKGCMARMKINSLNVCYMTFVGRRNTESVPFGAQILYHYPRRHFLCQRFKENQDRWQDFFVFRL
jgi:hypothetical protein